jgi:hypothetical protein
VQAYLIHINDGSDTNFKKILELKGVRRQDQPHLVELFQAHRASQENLLQNSPLLTPLQIQSSHIGPGISSLGHGSTPSLQGRFDPSILGSAIMSAARDGVDKLSTPALTSSNAPSGTESPSQVGETTMNAATNLNENLRNIGKFFRRDVGGFGGRFGGSKNSEDSGR